MRGYSEYANVRSWPKADIRTESKSPSLMSFFGEEQTLDNASENPIGCLLSIVWDKQVAGDS